MSINTPRFNFFDKEILKDPEREGQNFDKLKELDITCSSAGRGQLVVGNKEGIVIILDKLLNITAFKAHTETVTHLHQLRQHNVLFTIGNDYDSVLPECKIWLMDRLDSQGTPHCSRIIKLSPTGKDTAADRVQVSCFAVHENMQLLAVGLTSGDVLLYKGDVTKDRQSKFSLVHSERSGGGAEITGIALSVVQKSQLLCITTRQSLIMYDISVKDKNTQVLKENYGCAPKCTALSDDMLKNQFVVGRNDGVYFIHSEGRGATAPLEGEKYQVHCYRNYLVTVGKSNINRDMDIVTVYDAVNQFIAYSGPIPHVSNVLFEWGAIYVLGGDNRLYMLLEKATQTKLDILFKKNQYDKAIKIAKSQQYDTHGLVDIFRLYGDYLYTERGDHDAAIEQYMKTIGKLEPSYVIRKFLDAQRLHNLTTYLEELHNKMCATEDHTTLLLNCYTKLKDQDKLDEFIQKKDRNNEVNFDIETAIRVLRQADYHRYALSLAERHDKHEWYMKIQLENIKDYGTALQYMQNLSFYEAEQNLKKYGKVLIQALPSETTRLLKRLCLGQYSETERARPDEFIHIFVNNSSQLTEFLEAMIASEHTPATIVYNTLLELYLQTWAKMSSGTEGAQEEKTMTLLKTSTHYAKDQALVLCQMHKFKPGILYLYEQGKLYQQIVRYYMDQDDYFSVISSCKRLGEYDPHVWVMALSYFAKREDDCKLQMEEVLRNIDQQKLLPPLLVIQTLANSRVCTLGVVKEFIMDRLLAENDHIEKEEKLIKQYSEEATELREKIQDLRTKPQIFQVSRCSVCKYQLELPSIHFLCQHSYHTHCFESYAENENECPACLEENRKILETIKLQERAKDTDLTLAFKAELESTKDGFDVVAEYFGKGIFNKVTLLSEPTTLTPRDEASESFPSSNTNRSKPQRRNPFSGANEDMGSAGTYRSSVSSIGRSDEISSYQQAKREDMTSGYQTQSRGGAATRSSAPVTSPAALNRTSLQYTGGSSLMHSPSDLEVITTRPKQRKADVPTISSSPVRTSASRDSLTRNIPPVTITQSKSNNADVNQSPPTMSGRTGTPPTLAVSTGEKRSSGHNRQSSAGRMIESGLSFIKGHSRKSSDQNSSHKRQGSDGKRPTSKQSPAAANPFDEPPKSTKSVSSKPNPFDEPPKSTKTVTAKASRSQAANPFAEPSRSSSSTTKNPFEKGTSSASGANPFEAETANPFEEETSSSSNPFEKESSNPFLDEQKKPSKAKNPFEDEAPSSKNPFE